VDKLLDTKPSDRPQRARKSSISDDCIVYECEEVQMEGDPTSFEIALRSAKHLSGVKP
jgi:hypothetical protein